MGRTNMSTPALALVAAACALAGCATMARSLAVNFAGEPETAPAAIFAGNPAETSELLANYCREPSEGDWTLDDHSDETVSCTRARKVLFAEEVQECVTWTVALAPDGDGTLVVGDPRAFSPATRSGPGTGIPAGIGMGDMWFRGSKTDLRIILRELGGEIVPPPPGEPTPEEEGCFNRDKEKEE